MDESPKDLTPGSAVAPKSARTKSAIIDAALRLFRERGYEATTMRAIAAEADVSLGNAYYYFKSKEHLIQAFYDRTQVEHAEAAAPVLEREIDLAARIIGVVEAWVDAMEPYRAFAGTFFKNAADPTSPLSPFSLESADARRSAIALWQRVIEGSDARSRKSCEANFPSCSGFTSWERCCTGYTTAPRTQLAPAFSSGGQHPSLSKPSGSPAYRFSVPPSTKLSGSSPI